MIKLRVNGKHVELEAPMRLAAYLERLGVNARSVAVEIDGRILEKAEYAEALLDQGSVVEIVRMVGGGLSSGGL